MSKVSIWGPRGEVSACRERRRTCRGSGRLLIWCYSIPPSDGAGNSRLGKPQNCPFLGLSNLLRDKIFLDQGHRRPTVLLFQFWILTGSVGWRNDTGCQWWSSLIWNCWLFKTFCYFYHCVRQTSCSFCLNVWKQICSYRIESEG